jgi:uncharacterized glyoxalase superfamily protein PhnB
MDPRAPNAPWLTPYLTVVNAEASIAFYEHAFGFTCSDQAGEPGGVQHAEMRYRGELVIMFASEGAFGSKAKAPVTLGIESPLSLYLYVDDPDAMFKQAIVAGCRPVAPPQDAFWGDRWCAVTDVNGFNWGLARHSHG